MVYQFWIVFLILSFIIIYCDRKYSMLRDTSVAVPQPYSWARVQLAWWTVIILSSFISIFFLKGSVPNLHQSTVILLGISAATTATARIIDISDLQTAGINRHQNQQGSNFFLDILSDQNGASIHRFQAIVFNGVFGVWFISTVLNNLTHDPCTLYKAGTQALTDCANDPISFIMPAISNNNLILLGLSSATYAALKTTENKVPATNPAGNAAAGNPAPPVPPAATVNPNPGGNAPNVNVA
ncbi:MAG TPA: hypothetical protein VD996_05555 [Chitinophagaceae bacterium]|nr:hypothetical protein [Chitinophagaceae bacterium]